MRNLHVIMPMAGEGSRFVKEGYSIPKPLIKHNSLYLFQRALSSIENIDVPKKYSFIVRENHITDYKIDEIILTIYPDASIFSVKQTTRGAVETSILAEAAISENDSILIIDCDLEFKSTQFNKIVYEILSKPNDEVDGGVLNSFYSNDPRYSYAAIDASNHVIRTAEKEVISNHALVGAYFFSKSESFILSARKLLSISQLNKPEYYVSLLYNILLENKEEVLLTQVDEYFSYGTPEELKKNG